MEAVVALAIISLFAVSLLGMVGAQTRAADRGSVLLVARALAEDRMMAVQLLDYEALNDLPDSLAAGTFPEPFQDFGWSVSAAPVEDEYDLFTTEVIVTGRGYSFPLRSMLHAPRPVPQVTERT
jgi:hypothetical protein